MATMLDRRFPDSAALPTTNENIDGIKFLGTKYNGKVKSGAVIDFDAIDLLDYYSKHSQANVLPEYLNDLGLGLHESISQLVAWYPGMTSAKLQTELSNNPRSAANFFPPALYAVKLTEGDLNKSDHTVQLVPLDTAAPGTVKVFKTTTEANNYMTMVPDNYSIYLNTENNTYSFVIPNVDPSEWPGAAQLLYETAPVVSLTAGSNSAKLIALTDSTGTVYDTDGGDGVIPIGPANNLTWSNLLQALPNNYALDVLGNKLHLLGNELTATNTIGVAANNQVSEIAATKVTVTGNYPIGITTTRNLDDNTTNLATLDANQAYKSGTEFIEFSNGLRLYIANDEPSTANVPLGSIGIGWVADEEVLEETIPGEHVSVPAMGG